MAPLHYPRVSKKPEGYTSWLWYSPVSATQAKVLKWLLIFFEYTDEIST